MGDRDTIPVAWKASLSGHPAFNRIDKDTMESEIGAVWMVDLDGTVVESTARFHRAFVESITRSGGRALSLEHFKESLLSGSLLFHIPDVQQHDDVWADVAERFAHSRVPGELIPGTGEALETLKHRGAKICIVTSRRAGPEVILGDLARLGIDHWVDHVVTPLCAPAIRSPTNARDDKTAMFRVACQVMATAPAQTRYVTDWPQDASVAVRFGFGQVLGVLTGGYQRSDFPLGVAVESDLLAHVSSTDALESAVGAVASSDVRVRAHASPPDDVMEL